MSKFIGLSVIAVIALLAIGSIVLPLAGIIWLIAVNSLTDIIKFLLIAYVAMIPVTFVMDARRR